MDAVAAVRQPLRHTKEPNSKFTLRRQEFKKAEDVKLITHFAQWVSDLTEMNIQPDSFPEDLLNGIALCKIMMRIDGSGVTRYHPVKAGEMSKMDAFKARENVAAFQSACKRLDLPTSFGMDELECGDLGSIASTLVYVAHAAAMRNVGVKELDDVLRVRIGVVVKEKHEQEEEEVTATAVVEVAAPKKTSQASEEEDYTFIGLSLEYIKSLVPMDKGDMSVMKVASDVFQSKTPTCSWAQTVYTKEKQGGSLTADIVVCYDPECLWKDFIGCLESSNFTSNLVAATGTCTYWIDIFSASTSQTGTQEKESLMKRVIERIGRLEVVLSPWDKPSIALKSSTVWEVYCAVTCKAPMFASFLQRDQDAFLEQVYSGLVGSKTFQKVFYDLNVERAMSSDPEQILRVLRALRNEGVGATRVNDAFVIPIKNWIMEALKVGTEKKDTLPPAKMSNLFMTRGAFYQCIGQPDEARKYFDKVLQVQEEVSPNKDNPSKATALSNMAATLRELGEFKEAEQVCERALQIRVSCLGEGHPAVLVSRAWLGDILLASGEFSRALPILQKVLEDQEKIKASDIEISSAMNNLASALRETGKMEEARKYFEEVLSRVERTAGVDHPLYGAALNNCALTLEAQKDYRSALKMHEKSLALRIRALGADHPDVALSMHNLGVCLLREDKLKNLEQATSLGKKALSIWEKTLGPKHPTVQDAKKDWGELIK